MKQSGQPGSALTFTPALGKAWLTPLYDSAISLFTREGSWRGKLVRHVNLSPGDRLIDVGSGTGSLLRDLINSCPEVDLIAVEPDPIVLAIAQRKLAATATSIRWHNGFLDTLQLGKEWRPTKIVSSLVFHQVPLGQKRLILEQMHKLLAPGGAVLIADYMRQDSPLMRTLFRATVQQLDGTTDTQPNADGVLEHNLDEIFDNARPLDQFHTLTGTISLWRAYKKQP